MSITGQYDDENIFAKILRGEMPCVKVYENDHTLAFMDVFPQSKGHMLVIPKADKCRNLLEAKPDTLGHIMTSVQNLTKAANKALNPDGIIVTQFNGAPAGQTVFHLHFHIIPKYSGADMAGHAHGKMADIGELTALAKQIVSAL